MKGTSIRTTLLICLVFSASVTVATADTGNYAPSTALPDRPGYRTLPLTVAVAPGNLAALEPMYTWKPVNQFPIPHSIRQLAKKSSTSPSGKAPAGRELSPTGGNVAGSDSAAGKTKKPPKKPLSFDGIKGESVDKGHRDTLE